MTAEKTVRVVAKVQGYEAEGVGTNAKKATENALSNIDKVIDRSYGVSHGARSYEAGRLLKDSVEVKSPK